MTFNLQQMIDAFERISLDERLHIILRSEDDLEVCVEFDRNDQFRCWSFYFKEAKNESRQNCSRVHAVEVARAFKLPESAFAKELADHILTQAAFADQFVREVQELLGFEAVKESIIRTQLFMDSLREAVTSTLESSPLATSKNEPEAEPEEPFPPPHGTGSKLRIIKGS